tara:strand:+ start:1634 stop:2932 length:1299 start_codon:yes stop_codon:yes gene_type:complete
MGDVNTFFNAKIFAVVGASRYENKVGHTVFKNLLDYNKKVFPINNKAEKILGKKCYEDLLEIPYDIDCIIIAVPAKEIPLILIQAQKRKVKCAIIISSGFSEIGNKDLEERILKIAKSANITLLGPNSYGLINPHQDLNTTYFEGKIRRGNKAFISQSGAIGSVVLDNNEKLSGFISIGDSAQIDFSEFIDYYSKDKDTKVIALYIESLKKDKGLKFIEACKKCKKPIIALKSGKSKKGMRASRSHTAALASENGVYSGILKQSGVIEVNSIKELFSTAKILEKYPNLGNKAVIITNAGGLGVLTADACEENKIKIPTLSKSIIKKLDQFLPKNWSHNNPIDLVGDALEEDYSRTIEILEKENFDFFMILLTPQKMTEPLKTAKNLLKINKPIFACFLGENQTKKSREFLNNWEIINFMDVKEMCEAIGKVI